jgi:hypothetical protein
MDAASGRAGRRGAASFGLRKDFSHRISQQQLLPQVVVQRQSGAATWQQPSQRAVRREAAATAADL